MEKPLVTAAADPLGWSAAQPSIPRSRYVQTSSEDTAMTYRIIGPTLSLLLPP